MISHMISSLDSRFRPRLNDSAIQVFNVHCADGNPALACDDGNDLNGDGCSSTCEVRTERTELTEKSQILICRSSVVGIAVVHIHRSASGAVPTGSR